MFLPLIYEQVDRKAVYIYMCVCHSTYMCLMRVCVCRDLPLFALLPTVLPTIYYQQYYRQYYRQSNALDQLLYHL